MLTGIPDTVGAANVARKAIHSEPRELPSFLTDSIELVPVKVVSAVVAGYRDVRPIERTSFGMLTSFSATIAAARLVNYVRERRRRAPALRSVGRRFWRASRDDSVRVHHFVPGTVLAFVAGGAAILSRDDEIGAWLGMPFGSGVALTVDELALIVRHSQGYWGSESFALVQAGLAAVASAGLGARFCLRGLRADHCAGPSS